MVCVGGWSLVFLRSGWPLLKLMMSHRLIGRFSYMWQTWQSMTFLHAYYSYPEIWVHPNVTPKQTAPSRTATTMSLVLVMKLFWLMWYKRSSVTHPAGRAFIWRYDPPLWWIQNQYLPSTNLSLWDVYCTRASDLTKAVLINAGLKEFSTRHDFKVLLSLHCRNVGN